MSDIKWTLAVAQLDCASGSIVASPRWSGSVARLPVEAFSLSSAEAATTGYFLGGGLHELAEPADGRFHRGSRRSRVTAAFTSPSAHISSPVNAHNAGRDRPLAVETAFGRVALTIRYDLNLPRQCSSPRRRTHPQ